MYFDSPAFEPNGWIKWRIFSLFYGVDLGRLDKSSILRMEKTRNFVFICHYMKCGAFRFFFTLTHHIISFNFFEWAFDDLHLLIVVRIIIRVIISHFMQPSSSCSFPFLQNIENEASKVLLTGFHFWLFFLNTNGFHFFLYFVVVVLFWVIFDRFSDLLWLCPCSLKLFAPFFVAACLYHFQCVCVILCFYRHFTQTYIRLHFFYCIT